MRRLHDLYWSIIYRFRCPYPVDGHKSVRDCMASGNCGCDNLKR